MDDINLVIFSTQRDTASSHSNGEEDFPSLPQNVMEKPWVNTRPSTPSTYPNSIGRVIFSPSDRECCSFSRQLGNDWHYNFQVPRNMLAAVLRKKLDNQERPIARERRELISIIRDEILSSCKKHCKEAPK